MPFIFQFIGYCFLIILILIILGLIRKIIFTLIDFCYDKKNNIKKAKIVPLKVAKVTNLQINSYVIEIPTIEATIILY